MTNFLRLSYNIINKNFIRNITINTNNYYIYLTPNNRHGWMIGSFGVFNSDYEYITVCNDTHPEDYKIVSDWIK